MPTFREYKSKRPNRILYETITFDSAAFGTIRLVSKQIFPKTFAGNIYNPCRMEVIKSQQSSTPVIDSSVRFGRMAQDFKQQLKQWKAAGRITPISATYREFDAADMNTATQTWTLYVSDVSLDQDDVTCSLTLKNPLNNNVAYLYNTEEFPGLQNA